MYFPISSPFISIICFIFGLSGFGYVCEPWGALGTGLGAHFRVDLGDGVHKMDHQPRPGGSRIFSQDIQVLFIGEYPVA